MEKFGKMILLTLVLAAAMLGGAYAFDEQAKEEKKPVQLTEAQKNELSALHKDILEKKKQLISKYVEFGVISREKGDKIISHMEKRYSKLEKNGFVPEFHDGKKGHRHMHKD